MTDSNAQAVQELRRTLGENWSATLDTLLEQQASSVGQLDALSQRQHELVESERPERLLGVLAERQGVVAELTDLMEKMEPFNRLWPTIVMATEPGKRDDIVRRVESIAQMIERVNQRDAEDHTVMTQKRDSIAQRLAGVQGGKAAVAAYGNNRPAGPRFQDREA